LSCIQGSFVMHTGLFYPKRSKIKDVLKTQFDLLQKDSSLLSYKKTHLGSLTKRLQMC